MKEMTGEEILILFIRCWCICILILIGVKIYNLVNSVEQVDSNKPKTTIVHVEVESNNK